MGFYWLYGLVHAMTVSFVTIVPCAYVTGTKKLCCSSGTNFYVTRARDNGDRSPKRKSWQYTKT